MNNIFKSRLLYFVLFFLSPIPCTLFPVVYAGDRENFLSRGPSPAAYGRGEASVSKADDISSVYYNPALLSNFNASVFSLSYYQLYEGAKYGFTGFGMPVKGCYFSLSGINLKSGDVSVMQAMNNSPETINTNLWAYFVSLSKPVESIGTSFGAAVKYVKEDLYNYTGGGVGADLGAYKSVDAPEMFGTESKINLGLNLQNIVQPKVKLITEEESFSTIYRLGTSLMIPVCTRSFSQDSILVSLDLASEDNVLKYFTGVEYLLMDKYSIRAGYYKSHATLGLGAVFDGIKMDYSFDMGDYTSFHRIGFSYFFGNYKKEPQAQSVSSKSTVPKNSLMEEAQAALVSDQNRLKQLSREIEPLFKDAKKDFKNKRYLKASDKFRSLFLKYPEFNAAKKYLGRIEKQMQKSAENTSADIEDTAYALAYINYKQSNFTDAVNGWEKVLNVNPKRTEIEEYLSQVKTYIADIEKQKKDKEIELRVTAMFDKAVRDFDLSAWVYCIRGMEKVQETCKNEPFSKAYECSSMAQEYIDKSLKELSKTIKKPEAKKTQIEVQEIEADIEGSQKKYNDGLILYAQGKLSDAIRIWEIAQRLNPGNEKAKKALEKAREELNLSRKR